MSRSYASAVSACVRALTSPLRRWSRLATHARISENMVPVVDVDTPAGPLSFWCPNKASLYWPRAAYQDEPGTLGWIDSFAPGDVYWDIGACVGVFALYAARRGHPVYAFEANPHSYVCLVRNAALNNVADHMACFCLALDDRAGATEFFLADGGAGSVGSSVDKADSGRVVNARPGGSVSVLVSSVDTLIDQHALRAPTHIKIDVDSIEDRILVGATKTLDSPTTRSVLVEIGGATESQRAQADSITAFMTARGYQPTCPGQALASYNQIFWRA